MFCYVSKFLYSYPQRLKDDAVIPIIIMTPYKQPYTHWLHKFSRWAMMELHLLCACCSLLAGGAVGRSCDLRTQTHPIQQRGGVIILQYCSHGNLHASQPTKEGNLGAVVKFFVCDPVGHRRIKVKRSISL